MTSPSAVALRLTSKRIPFLLTTLDMAGSPSGKAELCKSSTWGSIPPPASPKTLEDPRPEKAGQPHSHHAVDAFGLNQNAAR